MAYLDRGLISMDVKKWDFLTFSSIFFLYSDKLRSEIFHIEFLFATTRLVSQCQMTVLYEKFQILASQSKEKNGEKS